jgi:hypothetical protein
MKHPFRDQMAIQGVLRLAAGASRSKAEIGARAAGGAAYVAAGKSGRRPGGRRA